MVSPSLGLQDHQQRAIRLGLAVLLACFVGYGVILPGEGIHVTYRKPFSQACKWCAITCVVVSLPVIGKVAQTGVERMVGTITGGWMGYATFVIGRKYWNEFSDGVILSLMAAIVAGCSILVGKRYKLDNSAKLFTLTFLLVTFGSSESDSAQGALLLTITRISGICSGVILSEILAVLVFPKSATSEALAHMRTALQKLTELNAMAWQHGPLLGGGENKEGEAYVNIATPLSVPIFGSQKHPEGYDPIPDKPRPGAWAVDIKKKQEELEAQAEKALMETYNALYKLQDSIAPAKAEIYVGKLRQQLCFLPGLPWLQMGGWALPEEPLQALATSVRRTARLLWTLHLSFQEGFDQNMMAMLQQQYPLELMPQLFEASQGTLSDMLAAFPNAPAPSTMHLRFFVAGVEGMLRVSDYQRRRIMRHMKGLRSAQQQPQPDAPAEDDTQHDLVGSAPAAPYLTRAYTTRPSFRRSSASLSPFPSARLTGDLDNPIVVNINVQQSASTSQQQPAAVTLQANEREQSGSFGRDAIREESAEDGTRQQVEDSAHGGAESGGEARGDLTVRGFRMGEAGEGIGRKSFPRHSPAGSDASSRLSREDLQSQHTGGPRPVATYNAREHSALRPLESPFGPDRHLAGSKSTRRATADAAPSSHESQSPSSHPSHSPVTDASQPAVSIWRQGTRVKDQYVGSPHAALQNLPEGLHINIGTPQGSDAANKLTFEQVNDNPTYEGGCDSPLPRQGQHNSHRPSDIARLSFHLQRVNSDDLIEFPETADGYVSKVRWYSFQFLMEELAEELEEMHAILGDLLSHLPRPFILQ